MALYLSLPPHAHAHPLFLFLFINLILKAGLAGEHSRMDGQPLGLALDLMLERYLLAFRLVLSHYYPLAFPLPLPVIDTHLRFTERVN